MEQRGYPRSLLNSECDNFIAALGVEKKKMEKWVKSEIDDWLS